MRIFLTGATGFIGSYVLNDLVGRGLCVRAHRRLGSISRKEFNCAPEWIESELCDVRREMLQDCQVVIHLAAAGVDPASATWDACFQTNVSESLHLWRLAADAGVKRFVVCGSCFEYGKAAEKYNYIPPTAPLWPTAAYHTSKAVASVCAIGLAIERQLELIVLRPFHVYGDGEASNRFWPQLRAAALRGRDFPMTSGEQIRDFVPVSTVASEFVHSAIYATVRPGRPIIRNVGTGTPQSLLEFATYWWKKWDARGALQPGRLPYRPNEVMRYVPALEPYEIDSSTLPQANF